MADTENVHTIRLTLDEDVSDKLAPVSQTITDFAKNVQAAGEKGSAGLGKMREEIDKTRAALDKLNLTPPPKVEDTHASLKGMLHTAGELGKTLKSAFEFAKAPSLGGIEGLLSHVVKATDAVNKFGLVSKTVASGAEAFAGGLGGVSMGYFGIATSAAAAGTAIALFGQKMAQADLARRRLGEDLRMSATEMKNFERAGDMIGQTAEETTAQLSKMSTAIVNLRRESASPLRIALQGHGEPVDRLLNETQELEKQKGVHAATLHFLEGTKRLNERNAELVHQMADESGVSYNMLAHGAEGYAKIVPASAEYLKNIEEANDAWKEMTQHVDNVWSTISRPFKQEAVNFTKDYATAVNAWFNLFSPSKRGQKQPAPGAAPAGAPAQEPMLNIQGPPGPTMMGTGGQTAPAIGGGWGGGMGGGPIVVPQSVWQGGGGDRPAALRSVGAASAEASQFARTAAGQDVPITLRETSDYARESSDYLREIRDIMVWLRDQIEGKGGPGGGAGLGGGGGGGTGTGTGGTTGRNGTGTDGGTAPTGETPGAPPGLPPLKLPTSPGEAPESLEAARAGGFMRGPSFTGKMPGSPGEAPESLEAARAGGFMTGGGLGGPGGGVLGALGGGTGGGGGTGNLAGDREKFRKELEANPELREKVMRIAANEQGSHPGGTQAVIESMMNRASVQGTTLAKQARWTGEGGYYAQGSMGRGMNRDVVSKSLDAALAGGNVSNFATDNASGNWGRKRIEAGMYHLDKSGGAEIHGELFSTPGAKGPGPAIVRKYGQWRQRMEAGDGGGASPSPPSGGTVPTPSGGSTGKSLIASLYESSGLPVPGSTTGSAGGGGIRENQIGAPGVTRTMPLAAGLKSQLEYAGNVTGLRADVFSGGQAESGPHRKGSHRHDLGRSADLKLWDESQKRYLNMSDPADQKKMAAYVEASVAAGATGVGGHPLYMGEQSLHIGGGTPATWGAEAGAHRDAPKWLQDAYARGRARAMSPSQVAGANAAHAQKAAEDRERDRDAADKTRQDAENDRRSVTSDLAKRPPGGDGNLGTARLDVNVQAPKGTKVKADGDGIFKDIRTAQTPQMNSSGGSGGEWNSAINE